MLSNVSRRQLQASQHIRNRMFSELYLFSIEQGSETICEHLYDCSIYIYSIIIHMHTFIWFIKWIGYSETLLKIKIISKISSINNCLINFIQYIELYLYIYINSISKNLSHLLFIMLNFECIRIFRRITTMIDYMY